MTTSHNLQDSVDEMYKSQWFLKRWAINEIIDDWSHEFVVVCEGEEIYEA